MLCPAAARGAILSIKLPGAVHEVDDERAGRKIGNGGVTERKEAHVERPADGSGKGHSGEDGGYKSGIYRLNDEGPNAPGERRASIYPEYIRTNCKINVGGGNCRDWKKN